MNNPITIKTLAKTFGLYGIDRTTARQLGQLTDSQLAYYAELRQFAAQSQWRSQVVAGCPMSAKQAIGYMLALCGVRPELAAAMAAVVDVIVVDLQPAIIGPEI